MKASSPSRQGVDLVYSPLVDAREYPHDVDVAIVEGAVSTEEDLEKIRQVRERTRILVALGDCADDQQYLGHAQPYPGEDAVREHLCRGRRCGEGHPDRCALPILLKHAVPLHDVVKIDLHVPGCPPSAPTILFVLNELLDGRIPDLRTRMRFG